MMFRLSSIFSIYLAANLQSACFIRTRSFNAQLRSSREPVTRRQGPLPVAGRFFTKCTRLNPRKCRKEESHQRVHAQKFNGTEKDRIYCRRRDVFNISLLPLVTLFTWNEFESKSAHAATESALVSSRIGFESTTQTIADAGAGAVVRRDSGEREPILQGMVYMSNPQDSKPRPSPLDTLIVLGKVAKDSKNGLVDNATTFDIIAGAKIPMTRVRFPLNFKMYEENLLVSKDKWITDYSDAKNIILEARVCPPQGENDAALNKKWCLESESSYVATGVARLISNIPGLESGLSIRSAAALPLE